MRILDTDVCIEILRGNAGVIARRAETDDTAATTWISVAELAYGAAKSSASAHNTALALDFLSTVDVLGLDRPSILHFGRLKARLERTGDILADADLLIASIAMAKGATLVTGNTRHYERIDELVLEDWIRG